LLFFNSNRLLFFIILFLLLLIIWACNLINSFLFALNRFWIIYKTKRKEKKNGYKNIENLSCQLLDKKERICFRNCLKTKEKKEKQEIIVGKSHIVSNQ
jgi:hypothetical protein